MISLDRTRVGTRTVYAMTFTGQPTVEDFDDWIARSRRELARAPDSYDVRIDMSTMSPLPEPCQHKLKEGQSLYAAGGLRKAAVLVDRAVIKLQLGRVGTQSGVRRAERFFASDEPDVHEEMTRWLKAA